MRYNKYVNTMELDTIVTPPQGALEFQEEICTQN
jgi:hypothetical protein